MQAYPGVGFYGKLPMLGDFVSRHLPPEFISPWDEWLQHAIFTSREQLGSDWLNSYLTSPIWRFVLSAGLCGNNAWAGIMMPSVDKVGRYFPFTLAVPFAQSPYLPHLFTLGDNWFKRLEAVALNGLEGDMNMAMFEELIENIPLFLLPDSNHKGGQIAEAFSGLDDYLAKCDSGYSLWTSSDHEELRIKLLAYKKLPSLGLFAGFLQGNEASMQSDAVFVSNHSESGAKSDSAKHWQSWAVTDSGKRRNRNEDAVLNRPEAGLWAVADGMGGHTAGDVASQLIVNSLNHIEPAASLEMTVTAVQNCLQSVNMQLCDMANQKHGNHIIGSTVVVLVAEKNQCVFLWAGDSRLYRLRNRQLRQLSKDHCPEYEYADTDEWAVKNTNEITRAVGAEEELELDYGFSDVCAGDIFLLCSDGLDKEVSLKEIEHVMLAHPLEKIADSLLALTLQREARDNVSIVVVATGD